VKGAGLRLVHGLLPAVPGSTQGDGHV
jgi:hypothetical protein